MKIINLQSENVKRLVAVDITPTGDLVEITGNNGQGKTSVLDSIFWALGGKDNVQAMPIREGEDKAVIVVTLGNPGEEKRLKVTRTFRLKKVAEGEEVDPMDWTSSVKVENEDGFATASPQQMLNELVGTLTFDPLAFLRMKPKDQLETLKALVKLDFSDLDAANKTDYEDRTLVNRDAEGFRAQANAIAVPAEMPEERADVDALIAELESAGETNADIERDRAERLRQAQSAQTLLNEASADTSEAEELEARAKRLRDRAETKSAEAARIDEELKGAEPLAEPVNTAELTRKITEARAVNAIFDQVDRKAELEKKASEAEVKSRGLTGQIKARMRTKAERLAAADMPIPGLDFAEDGVLMDGKPFDQASDAQQLRASIAIAAAMNPKLRVIRVRDGSLLDSEAMKALATFAKERDMQVWIETVASGREGAILIEDGRVVGADEPHQPALV